MTIIHFVATEAISLSANRMTGFIPSEIGLLTKLGTSSWQRGSALFVAARCNQSFSCTVYPTVVALNLENNKFSGTIPTEIALLTSLRE
jgi:hypothetical protein